MRKHLPQVEVFIGKAVPGNEDYEIVRRLGSGCNAHVFLAHSKSLNRDVACKIIPVANLIGADCQPPTWWQEIKKANQISSSRVVKFFAQGDWTEEDGGSGACVYLLSDYVRGESLKNYAHKTELGIRFVVEFFKEMLDFLRELKEAGVRHGDFHSGNIIVEDRSQSFTGPPYAFRVTDFGVAQGTSESKAVDDFELLARTLRELLQHVKYELCSPEERFIYNSLNDEFLGKRLTEQDTAYDSTARAPERLFELLKETEKRALIVRQGSSRRRLTSPFEYPNCEQIGEAHVLLKELYSDKMLGLPTIEDRTNVVLTGPRGCGKTTVFRCLSLRHRYATNDDVPASIKYVGVYYRCDDLYFAFPRYEVPRKIEAIDIPMHFVVATLAKELLESVENWAMRHFADTFQREQDAAARELWDIFGLEKPHSPIANTFASLAHALIKEREYTINKQRFANDPKHTDRQYWGPDTLPKVCKAISDNLSILDGRPIFFFVDDYSTPKVTAQLQRSLNRLFMYRSADCFFKLATESPASYELSDIDGKSYVEGREFRLLNIGIDFINAPEHDKLRFLDDVFNRRFQYTEGFPVQSLDHLVGDEAVPMNQNEVARQIRQKHYPAIWGRKSLGELCSGDVHFLIELVGKMVSLAGGKEALVVESRPAIAAALQNKAIRAEAGNFMRNLRALPNGQALVDVVEAFGNVASSYLRFRDSKNEKGMPPHQATRIEPYEDPRLNGATKSTYDELLRYSVFIEDVRGKSRRGKTVPRLYLRRFLIPFFNLTFSKRDSLEIGVEDFCELLLEPKKFESKKRLKSAEAPVVTDPQVQMFKGDNKGKDDDEQ